MPSDSDWKYLQKVNALIFWFKVPAKSKCEMPLDFWWKIFFCSFNKYLLLNGQKLFFKLAKKIKFHQKFEGILHLLFAGTLNQNTRAFTCCRYFQSESEAIYLLQLLSIRIWGYLLFEGIYRGQWQYIFETKFFPLEFEDISYNSVRLTRATPKARKSLL